MSSHSSETRVRRILGHFYLRVDTLEEAISATYRTGQDDDILLRSGDKDSYVTFIKRTLVAIPANAKHPSHDLVDSPNMGTRDLVVALIERIYKRDKMRNALTLGLQEISEDSAAYMCRGLSVEQVCPSYSINMFYTSPWCTLLERIGNKRLLYLLLNRAFFIAVTPSNYLQVVGIPIYEMWPVQEKMAKVAHPGVKVVQQKRVNKAKAATEQQKRKRRKVLTEITSDVTDHHCVTNDNNVTHDSVVTNDISVTNDIDKNDNNVRCHKVDSVTYDTSVACHTVTNNFTNDSVTSDKVSCDNMTVNHDTDMTHDCLTRNCMTQTSDVREVSRLARKQPCDVLEETGCIVGEVRGQGREDRGDQRQPRRRRRRRRQGKAHGSESGNAYSYHLAFDRRRIFYIRDLQEKFPGNYVLSKLKADDIGVMSLLDCVFVKTDIGAVVTQGPEDSPEQHLTDVYTTLMPHFKLLINNHKQCRYHQLLQKFIPLQQTEQPQVAVATAESHVGMSAESETPATVQPASDPSQRKNVVKNSLVHLEGNNISTLLEWYTMPRQIFLFLRAVCSRVIPLALWGSTHNKHVFFTNVRRFLELGRFERLTLGQLMKKIKVTECTWLDSVHSHLRRQELTAKFLLWMINDYVIVLLKSFFYITDSALGKNHVLYYRKTLWKVIRQKALAALLGKGMLSRIDQRMVHSLLGKGAALGVSYLRFLPKATSLRSIVSMSRQLSPRSPKKPSVNIQLRDLLHVLRFEMEQDPTLVGSSVFGISDIYNRWKTFVLRRQAANDSRCLYCVKVDIETCYDTVDGHRLFTLIADIFNKREHRYTIRHYVTVTEASGKLKRTFHSKTLTENNFEVNILVALLHSGDILRKNIHDAIIGDKVKFYYCENEKLLKTLKAHLFGNIVTYDGVYYLQTRGISQGSVLSTLLNNFYYGDLEKRHLAAPQDDELLMRHTDDFLFVTPHLDRATSFLDTLLPGIPEYNCHVNIEKTLCNFKYGSTTTLPPTALFPWCGLLIDPSSLEVSPDYTRCLTQAVSDSVTTELSQKPGTAMKDKLVFCLRNKCHAIFFDPQINSPHVTRTNIYNVFLRVAAMFQCIVHKFPSNQGVQKNPPFFFRVVQQLSRILLHRCKTITQTDDASDVFSKNAIEWLCCVAFEQTLQRRQSAYRSLLKLLHRWRSQLEKHMDRILKEEVTKTTKNAGISEELTRILD